MKHRRKILCGVALTVLGLAAPGALSATQPIGVYAIIDKVVFEPDEASAQRIQVWGAFSLSIMKDGFRYDDPQRGYLYFAAKPGEEAKARKEWADLKKSAGTGAGIGFGNRWEQKVTVRKADAKPADPDVYTFSIGVSRFDKDTQYPPIRKLVDFAGALSPADGAEVDPGKATLILREPIQGEHKSAKVFFEIERVPASPDTAKPGEKAASGAKESSSDVTPGRDGVTTWTPKMMLEPGAKYAWRVWAANDSWKSATKRAEFRVRDAKKSTKAEGEGTSGSKP